MKTKYFILAALAGLTFAGCSSDDLIAEAPPVNVNEGEAPIVFTSNQKAFTRADFAGKAAAEKLGNQFVVFGYKGSSTGTPGSTVFDNYVVKYQDNTANTTESNSNNWEYVGEGVIKHAADNGITSQTIKYWDYSQAQYDFIAWSTGDAVTPVYTDADLVGAQVRVSEIAATSATTSTTPAVTYLKDAFTMEGTAENLSKCYISDLVTVKKADYQQPVTLKFRQLGTKVRIGIYETVPGYSVKDVQFYTAANSALATDGSQLNGTLFTTTDGDIYTAGTYTIYYPTVDNTTSADNNQAHITFAAATGANTETVVDWGNMNYTSAEQGEKTAGNKFLGRTSNTATFAGDATKNYYAFFLPNETGTNLNLRVNYTLESIDGSGETILVQGATAQVPLIYTKWLPGYAYTYLFKISDKTNGYTGVYNPTEPNGNTTASNPAGLYPITFDAVVVNSEEDATQETITLVAAPSITTYQQNSTVVNDNEYKAATGDIYVTVNDGDKYEQVVPTPAIGASVAGYYTTSGNNYIPCAANAVAVASTAYYKLITPNLGEGALVTLTGKAALYTVPAGTTEAEVIDALQIQDEDLPTGVAIEGRNGVTLTNATFELTNSVEFGADGNAISVGTDEAAKFTPTAPTSPATVTTYAFVYTKQAAINNVEKYGVIAFSNTSVTHKYRYAFKAADAGDVKEDVVYYTASGTTYTKSTVYLGQSASNLYLDAEGTPANTAYAQSTTPNYYYNINGHFTLAHKTPFTEFTSSLFKYDGNAYVTNDDSAPQDGTTYYYYNDTTHKYEPCVILPEQTSVSLQVIDTDNYTAITEDAAIEGMTYFDKYTKNDGVYYVKVIKVVN